MDKSIKDKFPIFTSHPDLVYFDNAATTQKPESVIKAIHHFYSHQNANIHRGVYPLSALATSAYENVRKQVAAFLGAPNANCIAFTKGTTDGINILAKAYLKQELKEGDNIVISAMEHHANLIPWQMLAKDIGATLRIIPIDENGDLQTDKLADLLDHKTKLLTITAICNSIGTINPLEEIIAIAKKQHIPVLVDGAQRTGLYPVDLSKLDCDFYVFSAHKMFGPFGVGGLYVHPRKHNVIKPSCFGGGAIRKVTFAETKFLDYPLNMEAGTPNVAGVIGLGAAIDFCESLPREEMLQHIKDLGTYCRQKLQKIAGLQITGQAKNKTGIISFNLEGVHPHDLAQFLGAENIAVRAGHHCTQPLLNEMGVQATVRASFTIYNTRDEVDQFINSLEEIKSFWT